MSYIGTNKLGTMYLGDTKIGKAYLGDDLVYSSGPALPYTPLTWVGNQTDNVNITFNVGLRWLSTMTMEYYVQSSTSSWASVFNSSVGLPLWANDKNQINVYRGNNKTYDYLYFNTVTNKSTSISGSRHTLKFDGGFFLDGTRISTVSSPQSVAEGGSTWLYGYKIWGFKVWESGTLIMDLVPALYEGDYGLWDTINDTFYSPISGTITGG